MYFTIDERHVSMDMQCLRIIWKCMQEEFGDNKGVIRICKLKDRQHNGQKDNQRSTKSPNILSVLGWSPTIKEHKNHYHVHSQINLNNYNIIGVNVSSLIIIKWFVFLELLYWGSHLNSCFLTTSLTPLTRVRAPIKNVWEFMNGDL